MFNADLLLWIISAGLLGALLCAARISARSYRLPHILTLPLIGAGLIYNFCDSTDFYPYLVGAVSGYAFFWLIENIYKIIRKQDGLGQDNAKLLAAGGAWCAWSGLIFVILISVLAGLIYTVLSKPAKTNDRPATFGPFLALAISLVWIIQQIIP